jgi:hypothetical protein
MLKATGRTASGRPLLILGLAGENMARLMAGEPILIHAHAISRNMPEMTVVVLGGKTEDAIRNDVQQHLVGKLVDQLDELGQDRMAAYVAARSWAATHGRETPDDRMINAALDAVLRTGPLS